MGNSCHLCVHSWKVQDESRHSEDISLDNSLNRLCKDKRELWRVGGRGVQLANNNIGNYHISPLFSFFLLFQTSSSWDFICSTHACIQLIYLQGSLKYFCLWYWWWFFFLSCRKGNIGNPFLTVTTICTLSFYTLPKASTAAITGYWPCGPAQHDGSCIPASSYQIFLWEWTWQLSKRSQPVPVWCFCRLERVSLTLTGLDMYRPTGLARITP